MSLFQELRRRNVFRVGAAYAIVAWLLIQISVAVFPILQLPPWTATLVAVLLILGFPVALLLAWAFELTPEGIRPSRAAPDATPESRSRPLDYVLVAGLVLVAASSLLAYFRPAPTAAFVEPGGRHSVAVLPFEDMSPTGDQAYFGDGIADELLNELTRLDGIDVASRTSSFVFKGSTETVPAIGHSLGVQTVLEGGIRKNGDTVRVTAQLINVADGYHLWSQTYDRKLTDIFKIQEEIASAVAGALGVQFGVGGVNAFRGAGTNNVEAYESYLRALTLTDFAEATRILEHAVELDPNYAAAWAQLGLATASQMWNDVPSAAPGHIEASLPYVERAVELDPQSATAHTLLGSVYYARNDWSEGQAEQDRAIELRADYESLTQNGNLLFRAGRSSAALAKWDEAEKTTYLDTGYPNATFRVYALTALGRFDEARALLLQMPERARPDAELLINLSAGTPDQVRASITAITTPRVAVTNLYAPLLRVFDDRDAVIDLLHRVYADGVEWPSKWHEISRLAAYFRDTDFALKLAADEARFGTPRRFALWLPFMAEARKLPEFKQLCIDIHLVDYWRTYGWGDHCQPLGDTDFTCS
jgi:TolB-like protein/Tfp pilus assembly protein PilF